MNVYEVLNQTSVWIDRQGVEHQVDEMAPEYKLNVVNFLMRQADAVGTSYLWAQDDTIYGSLGQEIVGVDDSGEPVLGDWVHNEPSETVADMLDQELQAELTEIQEDPAAWLRNKPLLRRLLDDIEKSRGGGDAGPMTFERFVEKYRAHVEIVEREEERDVLDEDLEPTGETETAHYLWAEVLLNDLLYGKTMEINPDLQARMYPEVQEVQRQMLIESLLRDVYEEVHG